MSKKFNASNYLSKIGLNQALEKNFLLLKNLLILILTKKNYKFEL